jgi:hypothetical protein
MMNQSCCSTGLTIGGDACRASREEAKNNRQAAEKAGSWLLLQRSVGDCVKVPRLLVDDLWFSSARNIWKFITTRLLVGRRKRRAETSLRSLAQEGTTGQEGP